jgi:hypothetical protein
MKLFAFLTAWAVMLVCADASNAQTLDAHQPSTESVTVIGQKAPPEAVIKGFVQSYAASAPALGKMAKWARGICPISTGLPSDYNLLVTKRVRDVAAMVGAPLLNVADCKPNIDIVFTRQPQALLDRVRMEHPVLLGFHYQAQAEKIATVRYPIQAWYTTETEDEHGLRQIDNPQGQHGSDLVIPGGPGSFCPAGCVWHLPYAQTVNVSGSRISDTLSSQFFHVMVVIDLDRISGLEIGSLADDIAVMALAQPQSFDACLTPPSITNLMTAGCADKPKAMTPLDLAYLRGLYRTTTNASFALQKAHVVDQMTKALAGH